MERKKREEEERSTEQHLDKGIANKCRISWRRSRVDYIIATINLHHSWGGGEGEGGRYSSFGIHGQSSRLFRDGRREPSDAHDPPSQLRRQPIY